MMDAYKHIVAAVDLSGEGRCVAERAAELARHYGARVSLLHVVEYIPVDITNELVLPVQPEIEAQLVARAEKVLSELEHSLSGVPVSHAVLRGSTKGALLEYAHAQQVDLIVIGRHGRHGISRLLGSTANAVLHGAGCDVLAVRIARGSIGSS